MNDIATTPGPWIVSPKKELMLPTANNRKVILQGEFLTIQKVDGKDNPLIAFMQMGNRLADAALIAAAPELLDALIKVSEKLNKSKDVINLGEINEIISVAIEKIYAEAGG